MKKPPNKAYKNFARYSALGFQIVAAVILGILIGQWLDRKFNTSNNIFTLISALIMIIVSLIQIVNMINKND